MNAVHGKDYRSLFDEVIKVYTKDFDAARLEIQRDTLCSSLQDGKNMNIHDVLVCISNLFLLQNVLDDIGNFDLSNACNKFFVRAFIFPYLRSTMSQQRLNYCMIFFSEVSHRIGQAALSL